MDSRDLVYALPLIRAVVYPIGMVVMLQNSVDIFSPCRPPFFRFGLFVPVGCLYLITFILPLYRVIDFIAIFIKNISFFLFITPCSIFVKWSHCQHDMGMR